MAKRKKIGKIDIKKRVTNALIIAGTGAAAQVLKSAVLPENPETMDYIMMGAGLVLPEVVKHPMVDTAGNALLAVGAYRMAERLDLASKISVGVDTTTTTTTDPVAGMRGVGQSWKPAPKQATAASKTVSGAGNSKTVL